MNRHVEQVALFRNGEQVVFGYRSRFPPHGFRYGQHWTPSRSESSELPPAKVFASETQAAIDASISRATSDVGTMRTLAFVNVNAPSATEPSPPPDRGAAVEPTTTRSVPSC